MTDAQKSDNQRVYTQAEVDALCAAARKHTAEQCHALCFTVPSSELTPEKQAARDRARRAIAAAIVVGFALFKENA